MTKRRPARIVSEAPTVDLMRSWLAGLVGVVVGADTFLTIYDSQVVELDALRGALARLQVAAEDAAEVLKQLRGE